jgi:hypothetical protein
MAHLWMSLIIVVMLGKAVVQTYGSARMTDFVQHA